MPPPETNKKVKGSAKNGGKKAGHDPPVEPEEGGGDLLEAPDKDGQILPQQNVAVSVTVLPVREEDKLRTVSLRSMYNLLHYVYAIYLRTSIDKSHSLVDFISRSLLERLIADSRRKRYDVAEGVELTMENVYVLGSDKAVQLMLAEFIRPHSRNEYEKMMWAAVDSYPADRRHAFGTKDYDRHFAATTDRIVAQVLCFDKYMRHGIRPEDAKLLPPANWGDHGERGIIQIATLCLRPYTEEYKSMINARYPKRLKSTTTLAQWAALVREVNDHYSTLAHEQRLADLQAMPMEKAEDVQGGIEGARMQRKFIDGQGERRKPYLGEELGRVEAASAGVYGMHGGYAYEWDEEQYASPHSEPQLRGMNWQDPARPSMGPQPVRNLHGGGEGARGGWQGRGGGGHGGGRMGPRGVSAYTGRGASTASAPPRPPIEFGDKPLVCFKFAIGACDKGKECEYSHDERLAKQWLTDKVALYSGAKLFDKSMRPTEKTHHLHALEVQFWGEVQEEEQDAAEEEENEEGGLADGTEAHPRS